MYHIRQKRRLVSSNVTATAVAALLMVGLGLLHPTESACGLVVCANGQGDSTTEEPLTTTEVSSTMVPTTTSSPPTTTEVVPTTTEAPTSPAPTPSPAPPPPQYPNTTIQYYAVGCTADGITCIVKENATAFLAAVGALTKGRVQTALLQTSTTAERKHEEGEASEGSDEMDTPRVRQPNPFRVMYQSLRSFFSGEEEQEAHQAGAELSPTDEAHHLPHSSFASVPVTYYYAGSMAFQPALSEFGWDVINMTLAEGELVSEDGAAVGIRIGAAGSSMSAHSEKRRRLSSFGSAATSSEWVPFRSADALQSPSSPSASLRSESSAAVFTGIASSPSFNTHAPLPLSARYYAMGYLEGYVTFESILNNYVNSYKAGLETIFAAVDGEVKIWLQRNTEWVYRYVSLKTVGGGGRDAIFNDKLSHLVMQLKGMANGFVDACAADTKKNGNTPGVCTEAMMGPLLSNAPEIAFIAMQAYHELPDILAAYTSVSMDGNGTMVIVDGGGDGSGAVTGVPADPTLAHFRNLLNAGQGSSIVKLVNSAGDAAPDLIVGHTTWAPFGTMLRQYKTYNFEGSFMIGMSSRPGLIHSSDDFYMNGYGLTITSTQLSIFNNGASVVYCLLDRFDSIPTFYRSLIAAYVSQSIGDWQAYFAGYYPSCANNRQWVVVDMKRFDGDDSKSGENPMQSEGCVMVLETMAAGVALSTASQLAVMSADISAFVAGAGSFASYNLAYFAESGLLSGQRRMAAQNGTFFEYSASPRAVQLSVFQKELEEGHEGSQTIRDLVSAATFLQTNKFDINLTHTEVDPNDPNATIVTGVDYSKYSLIPNCSGSSHTDQFSSLFGLVDLGNGTDPTRFACVPKVSALLAISGRGDLNPNVGVSGLGYLAPFVGQMNLAGIDVKVTSRNNMIGRGSDKHGGAFTAFIRSGPSNLDQPTFNFSTAPPLSQGPTAAAISHLGLPDSFNFPLVAVASVPQVLPTPRERSYTYVPTVGIVGATFGCIFGTIVVILVTCTEFKAKPPKGYRPLNGSATQTAWLEANRVVKGRKRVNNDGDGGNGEDGNNHEDDGKTDGSRDVKRVGSYTSPGAVPKAAASPTISPRSQTAAAAERDFSYYNAMPSTQTQQKSSSSMSDAIRGYNNQTNPPSPQPTALAPAVTPAGMLYSPVEGRSTEQPSSTKKSWRNF